MLPTNGFSITPLKVKLLAGEQKATEYRFSYLYLKVPPQSHPEKLGPFYSKAGVEVNGASRCGQVKGMKPNCRRCAICLQPTVILTSNQSGGLFVGRCFHQFCQGSQKVWAQFAVRQSQSSLIAINDRANSCHTLSTLPILISDASLRKTGWANQLRLGR